MSGDVKNAFYAIGNNSLVECKVYTADMIYSPPQSFLSLSFL